MTERIESQTVPKRRLDVRVRAQRNRILIALRDDARELDPVAAFIWRRMDGSHNLGDIAAAVCAEYDVGQDTALGDIIEFASELAAAGFLDLAGNGQ